MRCCLWGVPLFAALLVGFPGGVTGGDRVRVRNVILIVVDTLAAQNLGFMQYDRPTSPFLDRFAEESIIFENAYSPKAKTLPAFTSIFTGLHPVNHRVLENGTLVPEDLHLLTDDFRDSGFTTWGIPAFRVIGPQYGLHRGFDFYGTAPLLPLTASRVIDRTHRMLENEPRLGEPSLEDVNGGLFLFLHFYDPHTDFTPDPEILKSFADSYYNGPVDGTFDPFGKYNDYELELDERDLKHTCDLYDAEIRTLDEQLDELFGIFERTGLLDNSVIVLTADHGENLGEHHFITHGPPYEKSLHVPLLIHFPDGKFGGRRIDALVEITDILPTLMDLTRIPIPDNLDGSSLVPFLFDDSTENESPRDYVFACGDCNHDGTREISVTDGRYRLTACVGWSQEPVLYDILIDPLETTDIASEFPQIADELAGVLAEFAVDGLPHEPVETDPETLAMLQSVGYL